MSHFALLDKNDIVVQVLVIEQDIIDTGMFGDPAKFVQTSYNTRGGVHYNPETGEPSEDQTKALRKNYAGVGYKYDRDNDAFIPTQPYPSWTLNSVTCLWEPPVPYPSDGFYIWDESAKEWVLR